MSSRGLVLFVSGLLLYISSCRAKIEFTVSPKSTALLLGSDLSLDCVAVDVPFNRPITYQWEFQNESIHSNIPHAFIFTNSSLFISRITQNELGTYTCVAQVSGDLTSAERSEDATIIKAYIEEFFLHPTDLAITEGSTATLTCVTGKSAPPAVVSWFLDGAEFGAGSQQTATFGNIGDGGAAMVSAKLEFTAAVEYSGIFTCHANNTLLRESVISDGANVTVYRVPVPPSFIVTPQSDIAPAGMNYSLSCSAQGYPDPTYSWTKDGQDVLFDSRLSLLPNGSLYFAPLNESTDSGTYICTATNSEGSITSDPADLTAAYLALEFVESPKDRSAIAGEQVTLTCDPPTSIPPAEVIWYKDDKQLSQRSGEFAMQIQDGYLVFRSIQLSDVGVYVCVAVNNYSLPSTRTSAAATLAITAAPLLIEPPIPTSVVKGDLFKLTCLVDGDPFPSVSWYHDDQLVIAGVTTTFGNLNQELIVSNANKLDEGLYDCLAVNDLGTITSNSVKVTVIVPPEITEPLREISVAEGSSVILPCVVYGDPEPAITWYHDDRLVEYNSEVFANASGLVITTVEQRDEGDYRCEATNAGGTKQTEGSLHIQVKTTIHQGPEDQTVLLGRSVVLQCLAIGQPAPVYVWNFNSSSHLPPGVTLSLTGAAIIITSAQLEQTGTYTCIASNDVGEDRASATLVVHEKPEVVVITGSHTVNQGSDLDLTCVVTGIPRPIILWQFSGVLVVPSQDGRISFPELDSLHVKFMTGQDAGDYKCIAENAVGTSSMVANVLVRQVPLPPVLQSVNPVSVTSINVVWEAPPTDPNRDISAYIIEYRDRSSATFARYPRQIPSTATAYEVGGLQAYTYYSFRVAAENDLGRGEFSSVLETRTLETVHANVVWMSQDVILKRSRRQVTSQTVNSSLPLAPSQPRNLQLLSHNATAVNLEWEVPEQTNGQIRTYQLHYRAKFTNDIFSVVTIAIPIFPQQRYNLGGLKPYTTYEFKVRGATIEQDVTLWGAFSNLLDVTTSPLAPSASPQNVRGFAVSPSVLQISWEALPSTFHNGPLSGYQIKYRKSGTSDAFSVVSVNATTLQVNLTGLLPWQMYQVQVYAYNVVGESAQASTLPIRTQPIAPSESPVNLQVVAISPYILTATWQPVPASSRNSEISGYMLEYTPYGLAPNTVSIGNADILTTNISDLRPYTRYDVRIRAFTTQVTNGFSPYGNTVKITTLEAAPGPVGELTATPLPYGLMLSWSPPERPNGVIRRYHVTYGRANLAVTDGTAASLHRDVVGSLSTTTLQTSETNITILNLSPGIHYNFAVAAETGAGIGIQPASLVISTDLTTPAPSTAVDDETTAVPNAVHATNPTTSGVSTAAAGNLDDDKLPLMVGLGVAGGVILMLVLLLIALVCHQRRKKKSGVYFIPPMAFKRQSLADIHQNAFNMDLHHPQSSDRRHSTSSGTYRSTSHHSLHPSSTSSGAQARQPNGRNHVLSPGAQHGAYPLDPASMDELHLAHIPDDWLRDIIRPSQPLQGLDNPAYVPDGAHGSTDILPSVHSFQRPPYTSSAELFGNINVSKHHRNRMRSETAAAIAAQKNRDTSVFDDTDMLIDDTDMVVVYNERTAL